MANGFRFGTPSIEEWSGLWKASEADSSVTKEEFYAAFDSLDKWMGQYGRNGIDDDCDFYVRGDPYGDKTQHVEIVNPHALTAGLLNHVQHWIKQFYPKWRILIPTFVGDKNVVAVYRTRIRLSAAFGDDSEIKFEMLRQQMLHLDVFHHVSKGQK